MTTVIQNLPTPPAPSDTPAEFNSRAFSLLGALPQFVTEANQLGSELTQASEDAVNAAQAAELSKESALGSAVAAGTHASNASASAGQSAGSAGGAGAAKLAAESARDAAQGYAASINPANLLNRANHTGTQPVETIDGLRTSAVDGSLEWYDQTAEKWKPVNEGRMFEIYHHNGPIEAIPLGFISANGQKWYAATYPDAAAALEAGRQFIVSEALWNSGVSGNVDAYKGCWSSGGTDATGRWYRAPKLNADTGFRAPFLRGSQIGVDAGQLTGDAQRDYLARIESLGTSAGANVSSSAVTSGAATTTPRGVNARIPSFSDTSQPVGWIDIGPSIGGLPVADENRPRYQGVIMCIRMFGAVSNPGSVDAAQLATDLGVANAKIAALESAAALSLSDKELLWSGSVSSGSITLSRAVSNGQKLAVVFTVSSVNHASVPSTFFSADANWPVTCSFVAAMPAYVGGSLTISGTAATVAVSSGAITAVYALRG